MTPPEVNGHGQDIHDNVIYIRGSITQLEATIMKLSNSIDAHTNAVQASTASYEKTIKYVMDSNERNMLHVKNSIPLKFMLIITGVICLAFLGGGILKELIDSHVISKLFSTI